MIGNSIGFARVCCFISLWLVISTLQAAPKAKLISFWDDREPESVMRVNNEAWQLILNTYLDDQHSSGVNRFDYKAVTEADYQTLKQYLSYLQRLEPRQFNSLEAKAYWINLYNALVVDRLIEAVQEDEVTTSRGLRWKDKVAEVAMQKTSLDNIEHGILRPIWKDPRVHFALTSGSIGGGNLQKTAYNGANVEQLLVKAEREFINHERAIKVDGKRAKLSSIFDWYKKDFADNKRGLLAYLKQGVDEPLKQALDGVSRLSYSYDWNLNSPDSN